MLLSMMLILSVTSCALELMIAAKVPLWRRLSAKSPLFNLLNSLAISFAMGMAFGGNGLVAMGAGVISTILSVPGYQFLHWNYDTPTAKIQGGNRTVYYWKNFHTNWARWRVALADFGKLIYSIIRVITFPIWAMRYLLIKARPYIVKYNAYVERRRAKLVHP
jgi:hypothetical protein